MNIIISHGLSRKRITALGIAPMKGPKKGIIFVTPIRTAINAAYGNWKIDIVMNVSTPIKAASIMSPTRNLPHFVSVISTIS